MPESSMERTLRKLRAEARRLGADAVALISPSEIAIDERARLKCLVPLCSAYGRNLMCPPYLPSVDEFRRSIARFRRAVILQVESDSDSSDKSTEPLSQGTCKAIEKQTDSTKWQLKLHRIVAGVETLAFKEGFRFALGLVGGECALCEECVAVTGGRDCRHPFEARPSMEAMGIDVVATCDRAGLPIALSARRKVRWTGMVLLD